MSFTKNILRASFGLFRLIGRILNFTLAIILVLVGPVALFIMVWLWNAPYLQNGRLVDDKLVFLFRLGTITLFFNGSVTFTNLWIFFNRLRCIDSQLYERATAGKGYLAKFGEKFGERSLHSAVVRVARDEENKYPFQFRRYAVFTRFLNILFPIGALLWLVVAMYLRFAT